MYDEQAVVLRTHACNRSAAGGATSASEARLCAKFVEGFLAPLQGRGAPIVEDVAALRARSPRTVCFRRLVAGCFFDMFNTAVHAGKEPFIGLYRQRVLAFHGVHAKPPTQHLLLLVRKQGRRSIHNFEQTLAFLHKSCDGLCRGLGRTPTV